MHSIGTAFTRKQTGHHIEILDATRGIWAGIKLKELDFEGKWDRYGPYQ